MLLLVFLICVDSIYRNIQYSFGGSLKMKKGDLPLSLSPSQVNCMLVLPFCQGLQMASGTEDSARIL